MPHGILGELHAVLPHHFRFQRVISIHIDDLTRCKLAGIMIHDITFIGNHAKSCTLLVYTEASWCIVRRRKIIGYRVFVLDCHRAVIPLGLV